MIINGAALRRVSRVGLAVLLLAVSALPDRSLAAAEPKAFAFLYVSLADDAHYAQSKGYTGLVLRDRQPPVAGAEAAIRESRIIGRSIGVKFALEHLELETAENAAEKVERLIADTAAKAVLLDLPLAPFRKVVERLADETDVLVFNIRHRDDALREQACAASLFHALPSNRMLTDALAQYLKSRGWTRVLVLARETADDQDLADRFVTSAKKFGLAIADRRAFVLGNDPRQRDKNNIALLTGGARYDAVFLADGEGEFGRYVPYATFRPRPVVGTDGLVASAWHRTWERYGAPQLNQRFDRRASRRMAAEDWAAWVAVRSVVEAVVRGTSTDVATIREILTDAEFAVDLYKGVPGSFRPWNQQLRQPILLHTYNAVIARAPIEGFLHKDNSLDSLGIDRSESACRLDERTP
ncbi:MAG TPA: ABC transporter substrate-binding protein [Afifellaceae bacterium]|nr:ABC transporter substrate-binding protein [Afifellaceae bacterium]